ncbi:PSD1 and planctomycete cytochrome C domain-containing protein [bacterium]|nr:PSD1 and planctomycete cytochrome C domain-containing protein [bacterium]
MSASLAAMLTWTMMIVADDATEHFEKSVRPILVRRCQSCHGDPGRAKGGLLLTSRESLLQGGNRGPAIVPGKPDESLVMTGVRRHDELKMPPDSPLPADEIESLRKWIADGAPWGESRSLLDSDRGKQLWSFSSLQEPTLATSSLDSWCARSIDRFIAAKFVDHGMQPSPPADKATWVRRVFFDMIGLPPTLSESQEFMGDSRPDAKHRLVDKLISSPRYAERWARRWLDVVRYAETNGFEDDFEKPNAFRFRDYVIEAFNVDLPFDQFVKEQIAGDLITPSRPSLDGTRQESPIGSGFWWLGEIMPLPFCVEDARKIAANEVETQVDTYGKAFLGLTIACARCHDHKFDPIPTEDYYAVAGSVISTTNVQQVIESADRQQENQRDRSKMERLDRDIEAFLARRDVVAQLRQFRLAEAGKIASYLLADGPSDARSASPESDDALDPAKLAHWKDLFLIAVPSKHPILYPWGRLLHSSSDTFHRRARSLVTYLDETQSQIPAVSSPTLVLGDFDSDDFGQWKASGEAFGVRPSRWNESRTAGAVGQGFISSDCGADHLTGRIVSPPFTVTEDRRYLYFMLGGGNVPFKTCVNVVLHSQAMPQRPPFWTATGMGDHVLRQHWFDLQYYINMEVFIEIVDASPDPGGYISADRFFFSPTTPPNGEFAIVHPLIRSALRDVRTKEEFAHRLQDVCLTALGQSVPDDNSAANQPWNTLRQWLEGDDSPILSRSLAIARLPSSMRDPLNAMIAARDEIARKCRPSELAMVSRDRRQPSDAAVHPGGEMSSSGPTVPRGFPRHLVGPSVLSKSGSNRLALADWTASAQNPLTARVFVNRVWAGHFRRGLVATMDNFGTQGETPSHPELLDYLARRFVDEGWSTKWLHRELVLSSTYGQDSRRRDDVEQKDPENALCHRAPVRRLEAEAIRDSILFISGSLDDQFGGPSVPLNVELNVELNPLDTPGVKPSERRRSIYLAVHRNHVPTLLEAFDFPRRPETMGERTESALPVQALDLLNSEFLAVSSQRWAEESTRTHPDSSDDSDKSAKRIDELYRSAFGRSPDPNEQQVALRFLTTQKDSYRKQFDEHQAQQRAWSDYCHVLFNVSEFIYVR